MTATAPIPFETEATNLGPQSLVPGGAARFDESAA